MLYENGGASGVRPSSLARMKRRSQSEIQELKQKMYQHYYMQGYRAQTRRTVGGRTVYGHSGPGAAVKRGPPRKIQMLSVATNRKQAPPSGRVQLPRQMYGHAAHNRI
jgi:hypothetical protein